MKKPPIAITLIALALISWTYVHRKSQNKPSTQVTVEERAPSAPSVNIEAVKSDKNQLTGLLDDELSIRSDVASWIKGLDLDKEEKNALLNLALADQLIFKHYDSKENSAKLLQAQQERSRCLLIRIKDAEKRIKLIGQLRSKMFNSQDRAVAFYIFLRNRTNEQPKDNRPELSKKCLMYYKGKVLPSI